MYRLFYNFKVTGDVLFVLLDPEKKVTRSETKGRVVALYAGETLVGANIFRVSEVFHLKTNGIIFAPDKPLLDVVNSMLKEAELPLLAPCLDSGYKVAKITKLEEHPLDEKAHIVTLSLGEKTLTTVSWYPNLNEGALLVVATDGTILYDGSLFHKFVSRNIPNECSICSSKELKLDDKPGAFIVEGYEPGEDFFLGGH
jgi:tRNA-binding EMAP/Myf-like protein